MRWPSKASDIEISFHTLCTCLQIVREIVQPEKGSKLANLLPNFKQIVGCETWSRSGEKYFKQQQVVSIFPWCLDQEMTSYTFLLPQSISWQVPVRILLRAPRVVITRARARGYCKLQNYLQIVTCSFDDLVVWHLNQTKHHHITIHLDLCYVIFHTSTLPSPCLMVDANCHSAVCPRL